MKRDRPRAETLAELRFLRLTRDVVYFQRHAKDIVTIPIREISKLIHNLDPIDFADFNL
jgi:hypothetical protein